VIEDSFIPMAEYLIRQSSSPGCPTTTGGVMDSLYCPTRDYGLVTAKLIPAGASLNSAGVLDSQPAEMISWGQIYPASQKLRQGAYKLVYRAQNFSTSVQSFKVSAVVEFVSCPSPTDCWSTVWSYEDLHSSVPSQGARNGDFDINLDFYTGEGQWYEVKLRVKSPTGGTDDFASNDKKVFRLNTLFDCYLPLVAK